MKRIYALLVVGCMLFTFSACSKKSEKPLNRNQELVGCWVTKSNDGLIVGVQFFSDGTYYERYNNSQNNWSSDDGSFCAEYDGTFKGCFARVCDYKLEKNKLIVTNGDETMEFTKWDKNISHIEEYSEN